MLAFSLAFPCSPASGFFTLLAIYATWFLRFIFRLHPIEQTINHNLRHK